MTQTLAADNSTTSQKRIDRLLDIINEERRDFKARKDLAIVELENIAKDSTPAVAIALHGVILTLTGMGQ